MTEEPRVEAQEGGSPLAAARVDKLQRWRQRGVDPYPPRVRRSHSTAAAVAAFVEFEGTGRAADAGEVGPEVQVAGRLVANRSMGRATFAHIDDGDGRLQLHLRQDILGIEGYAEWRDLDLGDFIGAEGTLFRTRTGEVTLRVHQVTLLAKALRPLPEKWHGLSDVETRYRQRYLDLASNRSIRQLFWTRGRIVSAVRRFMDARGFLEAETPVLQPLAGGAAARPFRTHHHALDRDLYLRIALELHLKRLLVGGYDRVYEIGRVFRNEGIDTRHNPEFTLMESYEAYADYLSVMEMTEDLVATVARDVLGRTTVEWGGHQVDLAPPWRRVTVFEAIREACGVDLESAADSTSLVERLHNLGLEGGGGLGWGDMIEELLDTYVVPRCIQPTFLVDYPVDISPLAKSKPGNPRLVERFEAFVGGSLELANAFSELNDPLEQRQRFQEQMQARGIEEGGLPDEDFLRALEHGMPPAGGLGVGIDRLVMLLTGQRSIREVILFPQLRSATGEGM